MADFGELRNAYCEKFSVIQNLSENTTTLLRVTKGLMVYTLDVVEGIVEPLVMLGNKFPGVEFDFVDERNSEYGGVEVSSTQWVRVIDFDDAEIIY